MLYDSSYVEVLAKETKEKARRSLVAWRWGKSKDWLQMGDGCTIA